jgi:tetratricopeptide (TPR) repeat protein
VSFPAFLSRILSAVPSATPGATPARWLRVWVLVLGFAVMGFFDTRAGAESFIWVDDAGMTHLTDDPEAVPPAHREAASDEIDSLRGLWKDSILGPAMTTPVGGSGRERDRHLRLLRGAVNDLRRGETARAAATLRSVKRLAPKQAETYWYLAMLDRQRGRYESAHTHLKRFLELAGDDLAAWRKKARQLDGVLRDERRLVDTEIARGPIEFRRIKTPNFRIEFDSELASLDQRYAETVLRYLEEARNDLSTQIGVTPLEPLGVVLYGKAAYLQAHRHRFSFQTVGFFDGRIHVTSPAHPTETMRSLLYHEYTHAVYRDQTGGDRPYWLNEGLAERMERRSRRLEASTRSERISLRTRIEARNWIPLRTIAPSFSGLSDEDARAAYLESVVAAAYIEAHTSKAQRARMLERIGAGFSADQALHEALGLDTDGLDAAVQKSILDEFPSIGS